MDLKGNAATWLGHGTWMWETSEGKRLLIDCWLEGNPATPEQYKDPSTLDLDGILITHGHFDHIGQGGSEAIRRAAHAWVLEELEHLHHRRTGTYRREPGWHRRGYLPAR